jgi:hypothetical protein
MYLAYLSIFFSIFKSMIEITAAILIIICAIKYLKKK